MKESIRALSSEVIQDLIQMRDALRTELRMKNEIIRRLQDGQEEAARGLREHHRLQIALSGVQLQLVEQREEAGRQRSRARSAESHLASARKLNKVILLDNEKLEAKLQAKKPKKHSSTSRDAK
jgi:hypothetical protein